MTEADVVTEQARVARASTVGARALAGVVSAGVVLGVGQLVSGVIGPETSPWFAVGSAVVDAVPTPVREWAIDTFGTADKTALFIGMGIVIAALTALAGIFERVRRPVGSALFGVLGIVGVISAGTRVDASALAPLPTVLGVGAGILLLRMLTRRLEPSAATGDIDRRRFLTLAGSGAVAAGAAAVGGWTLGSSIRNVSADRAAFTVPTPVSPAPPVPAGANLDIPGLSSFVTANDDFYRIDTALTPVRMTASEWSLRIHGMVENEITLTWADLARQGAVERMVTLTCVSNAIGGDLVGNAMWTGYPIKDILAQVRPLPGADMALSRSRDAFSAGTPLDALTDGRDAILAVAMNGQPLPVEHGYPVRMVVPGLYGYVSATKWVTDIEITQFSKATAYWTDRGWSAKGPIKTATRIDTPRDGGRIQAGRTAIAGVAWAQHTGISAVEVRIDGGAWQSATLSQEYSRDTWRQWTLPWEANAGQHTIEARATDATGAVQTETLADTVPDGATGYAATTVRVDG